MTSPGIGASSILGVAAEVLLPPVFTSATPVGTGGNFTAGAYRWVITAINASGETQASNEVTATLALNGSATLLWSAVTGATGYRIYRSAVGGGTGTELFAFSVGAVTTFTDITIGVPAGAFPTINSAANPGVYVAPTKFVPYLSETLKYVQATIWRRPVRNTPGLVGAVAGNSHIEGDIVIEALSDCVPWLMSATRCTFTKTGTAPFTYVFTPAPIAIPTRTLSVTIVRNGIVFGYVGVAVTDFKYIVGTDGELQFTATCMGLDEAVQAVPTATWPTSVPFGPGSYSYQVPTASAVFDADAITFESNDNGQVNYRIDNNAKANFINFGESAATLNVTRDFLNRTDYDAFKALTAQSITLTATHGAGDSIAILAPVALKDTYDVNVANQGDLLRAQLVYQCAIDGTGKHYQITIIALTENMA